MTYLILFCSVCFSLHNQKPSCAIDISHPFKACKLDWKSPLVSLCSNPVPNVKSRDIRLMTPTNQTRRQKVQNSLLYPTILNRGFQKIHESRLFLRLQCIRSGETKMQRQFGAQVAGEMCVQLECRRYLFGSLSSFRNKTRDRIMLYRIAMPSELR